MIQQYRTNYNYPNSKLEFKMKTDLNSLIEKKSKKSKFERVSAMKNTWVNKREKDLNTLLSRKVIVDPFNAFLNIGTGKEQRADSNRNSIRKILKEDVKMREAPLLPTFNKLIRQYQSQMDTPQKKMQTRSKWNSLLKLKNKIKIHSSFLGIYSKKKVTNKQNLTHTIDKIKSILQMYLIKYLINCQNLRAIKFAALLVILKNTCRRFAPHLLSFKQKNIITGPFLLDVYRKVFFFFSVIFKKNVA